MLLLWKKRYKYFLWETFVESQIWLTHFQTMFHFYTTSTCYEYFYLEISIFSEILEVWIDPLRILKNKIAQCITL